ncbi:hypothetical protein Tco_0140359 [Tanacetum coccineum]
MSESMPTIPTQSTFTYPNPNPSASPSFTQDDTSDSFIPEPSQPIPTYTQPAFSQPAFSQPNQSFFSQPAVHLTQPSQTNPNNVQSQQFQQFQTANVLLFNSELRFSLESSGPDGLSGPSQSLKFILNRHCQVVLMLMVLISKSTATVLSTTMEGITAIGLIPVLQTFPKDNLI